MTRRYLSPAVQLLQLSQVHPLSVSLKMAPHADTNNGSTQQSNTTGFSNPPCSMLHVEGADIVDASGSKVILKGAGLGGHLNFENFITGYPGHEHEHRAAMAEVLGKEKAQYFFDRLIHYFFTDADAAYFQSLVSTVMTVVSLARY